MNTNVVPIQPTTQSNVQMNECEFFHYAPNDDRFYHITCQIILHGSVSLDNHNYDHGFFYNIDPTENYYVTCKIFSHSLIANILNKKIYGKDIGVNNLERKELLSLNQKLDLERDLKQILPLHLTQNHISNREIRMNSDRNLNSSYGHNAQKISVTNKVFINIPQQVPDGLRCNENTNTFCGNVGNNVMKTQAVSIANSQTNSFLQPNNLLSASAAPQNVSTYHITGSPQQIDFNNIPQQIIDREMRLNCYRNVNSFHGSILANNTQSVLTTDISRNYGNDLNGTRQRVDPNNNYGDTDSNNRNIGNNITTTHANGLTCDHQTYQVNYGGTDFHNGNTVTTMQANDLTCDHLNISDNHIQHHQQ
ncbi:uncharacterized protein OCT59_010672 [Rhizophagus irregularis]|nr:hypothetical protein OCT59_010672 [Rhizophagus irregularis]GBC13193.1 hypothetical protein GLOIN_2v1486452 [Rhizophagus irregularis DAOM 181602=DAOM 197198]CAG8655515.1 13145_t:CDS:2 [Rhizophagus irregularis]